jgi:hypothetical protein
MPASTWQKGEHQLDVFPAINGAHTEIYWACVKLCEVQCLKMYWFLKCTFRTDLGDVS